MSAQPHTAPRPFWIRALDGASLAAFAGLWLWLAARALVGHTAAELAVGLAFGVHVALVAADLASGCVHWLADTFFDERTPVLGPALIHPFREHHADPAAITRHGFFEVSGNNALVTLPLLVALLLAGGDGAVGATLAVLVLVLSLAVLLTNQIHKWAHAESAAPPVRWLQRHGWILDPAHHARHHAPPHVGSYCVTFGWLNPSLDRLGVFGWVEAAVRRRQAQR